MNNELKSYIINGFYIPKVARLSDDLMFKMNAKRLREVFRAVRDYKRIFICHCGCGEIIDKVGFKWFEERASYIKSILDKKEHIK